MYEGLLSIIVAFALWQIWNKWDEMTGRFHVRITDLESEVKSLKEDLKWQQTETRILGETKLDKDEFKREISNI